MGDYDINAAITKMTIRRQEQTVFYDRIYAKEFNCEIRAEYSPTKQRCIVSTQRYTDMS